MNKHFLVIFDNENNTLKFLNFIVNKLIKLHRKMPVNKSCFNELLSSVKIGET